MQNRRSVLRKSLAAMAIPLVPAVAAPAAILPTDHEICYRYLAWLSQERRFLGHELGCLTADGFWIPQDRLVNLFFTRYYGGEAAFRPSGRAATVLTAAGALLDHDPDNVLFGDHAEEAVNG